MQESILLTLQQAHTSQRASLLADFIRQRLFDFLALDDINEVAGDVNFASLGADSMQAVDFKVELESHLACALKTTLLFDYPQLNLLVDHLLNNILSFDVIETAPKHNISGSDIAIIAMAGIFPDADNEDQLWNNIQDNQFLTLTTHNQQIDFGRITDIELNLTLEILGISTEVYTSMGRQQKLMFKVLADAMMNYSITRKDLSSKKTGVFIGAKVGVEKEELSTLAYRIPLPNEISFHLDLKGPSEVFNTFCTSVYVALHRAIQSIQLGECEHAMIGGINTIEEKEFTKAAKAGLYDELLSKDNKTRSFSDHASGYTRSEGAGILMIKSVSQALQDNNQILALVKGTAVFHGGKGYSVEAPNAQGMKEAIKLSLTESKIDTDSIDYIEAHGIGNILADAVELGAINSIYRQFSSNPDKKWHISSIKPTTGHPEIASGMASLIKVIKALEHKTIPGLVSLDTVNSEIGTEHSLILQKHNQAWTPTSHPRRAALNSFAMGGVNAHIILEQWQQGSRISNEKPVANIKNTPLNSQPIENQEPINNGSSYEWIEALAPIFYEAFEMEFSSIDPTRSIVSYGFDSINVIQFVTHVNETLGIAIKIGQVLGVDSIADFIQLIEHEFKNKTPNHNKLSLTQSTDIPTQFPLSEIQKGLWYIQKTAPLSTSFNLPLTFKIKQAIDSTCLEQAMNLMLEEYPMLSLSYLQETESETIVQQLRPTQKAKITESIFLTLNDNINQILTQLLRQPFDLENDLLVRLYRVENTYTAEIYVYFVIHHLIFDGISGALFITSFWEKYHQLAAGHQLIAQAPDFAFYDYIRWEQNYLASPEAQNDLAWWKAQLEGISATINLPYDKSPQANEPNLGIGCESITLDAELFQQLKQLSLSLNANFSVLLLAIFNLFLHTICQESDIVISTPVLGRPKKAFEKSIGCYINLILTCSQISDDQLFTTLLAETKTRFISGIDHAYYPFSKLMPALGLTLTNPNETPFPISYSYQNIFDNLLKNKEALSDVEPLFEVFQETEDHYTLEIYDLRDSLKINLKYKRNLFEKSTIQRHLGYFTKLIEDIAHDPNKQVKDYEILPEREKQQQLHEFNQTQFLYPKNQSITDLFVARADQTPDAVALIFDHQQISYQTLEQKSKQLAIYLQQRGVSANTLVAVCIHRSIEMIIAVFAILRAGGAYLPIDPNNTTDRINFILKDARVSLLLTQTALQEKITALITSTIIAIDGNWAESVLTHATIHQAFNPNNLAYVIYTSGSSGQPKGVMVSQQSLVNLSYAMIAEYGIHDKDRIVQFASLSFDMSVEEIFPYLIAGAAVVIRQETDIHTDHFYRLVMDNAVSIINIPPLFYNVIDLLSQPQKDKLFTQLRLVAFGGEALPDVVLKAVQTYNVEIFNAYGPTECTVNAAMANLSHSKTVNIGKPILNTQLYVLKKELKLLPIGVCGELYIAGDGVAKGYLNRPELTAEKFIDNPFAEGKLYKTGDLVRWTEKGTLDYIGRLDDQVKIRGYRVELGEVENVLVQYVHIKNAVVIAQSHSQGNKLIAYYVLEDNIFSCDDSELRSYCREQLPDYMLPSAFVQLDKIPVTSNDKTDKQQLQNRDVEFSNSTAYVSSTSPLESDLVNIWQQALDVEQVGIEDDFFALGGHSLIAVQMVLKINQQFSVDIPLSILFEAENIKNLALIIADSGHVSEIDTLASFEQESVEWLV